MSTIEDARLAVIGLGYVGLPLAAEFGRTYPVLGFDVAESRIAELRVGHDRTRELEADQLEEAKQLRFSSNPQDLNECNIFIVTVPTPIDRFKRPDLHPLHSASRTVGQALCPGDLVIFESTVFPGATEEECVPILEQESGLAFNVDFFVGYSPERINPGDKEHRLTTIKKVTSGSTPETCDKVDALYASIISAGTHKASSIRVAEAAKVIENTQRDLNVALINELALIFERMNIDTLDVLEAAGTKWNFLPFRPGLVGGHCISVDPYYLSHKAQELGYLPELVLAGRRINDSMGEHVANKLVRAMIKQNMAVNGARILVLGLTFKENCPDLRNTKVIDIIRALEDYGVNVDVHDPHAEPHEAESEYGLHLCDPKGSEYAAVIVAVAHDEFRQWGVERIRAFTLPPALIFDLKGLFPKAEGFLRL